MPLLCPRSKGVSSHDAMKYGLSIGLAGVHEYNGGFHPGNSHEEFNKAYFNYIKNKKKEQTDEQPKNTEPTPEPTPEPKPSEETNNVVVVKKKLVRSKSTPTEKKERKPRVSKSKKVFAEEIPATKNQ